MKERVQDPADILDYSVDFEEHLARVWEPNKSYAQGTMVRPPKSTGFQYESTTAGRTAHQPPRFPTALAGTVTDGSAVWTARAIATTSLKTTLSSAAWTADTGLTVSGASITGQVATCNLSGGTHGQDYRVRCAGTMADGTVVNVTFLVKVRRRED